MFRNGLRRSLNWRKNPAKCYCINGGTRRLKECAERKEPQQLWNEQKTEKNESTIYSKTKDAVKWFKCCSVWYTKRNVADAQRVSNVRVCACWLLSRVDETHTILLRAQTQLLICMASITVSSFRRTTFIEILFQVAKCKEAAPQMVQWVEASQPQKTLCVSGVSSTA